MHLYSSSLTFLESGCAFQLNSMQELAGQCIYD
jgi:hypothetical protein